MEKEKQAAETEESLYTAMADDRLTQLPIHILHHILCFLSQKEALRTCLLSKQWRHIGSTRPNLEFSFGNTQEKSVPVVTAVNRILQGFCDQNLSVHQLRLEIWRSDSRPVTTLLEKWIPMIPAFNIKVLKLDILFNTQDLPSAIFLAESLEELHLCKCRLSPVESVRLKSLRALTLEQVQVDGGTSETIMLGCPLLTRLVLRTCWEFRNIRLSEAASSGLKHFELRDSTRIEGCSIEIDVPNLETVSIWGPWIWCHSQSALLFFRLTRLSLNSVILSSKSFDLLSFGCPTLAYLSLDNCSGFEEFHLASDSIMFLRIRTTDILLKGVTICAPNIVNFEFTARISQAPDTFSFTTTTSKEWSSKVFLYSPKYDPDLVTNSWFLMLRQVLKALSGSQISLILEIRSGPQDVPCSAVISDEPPVVLQDLNFYTCECRTASWYTGFTNGLFRVCRPSHVWGCTLNESNGKYRLSKFQLNILLANKKVRTEPYFWRDDLEQVFVESLDGKQWQLMKWKKLGELRKGKKGGNFRLRLKWRC